MIFLSIFYVAIYHKNKKNFQFLPPLMTMVQLNFMFDSFSVLFRLILITSHTEQTHHLKVEWANQELYSVSPIILKTKLRSCKMQGN